MATTRSTDGAFLMNSNMTTTAPQLWNQVLVGDNRETLKLIPDCSIDCCITSPPYWGLRDYGGQEKQIGLEDSPEEFVDQMVSLFSEVYRTLTPHGTLWLNLGDSYLKKSLLGLPWLVAIALKNSGWFLRQEIIWHKPAPMPAAVRDRCTTSHEAIFLLSKSPSYFFDWYAISEPCSENTHSRGRAQAPKAKNNDRNGKNASKQNAHFQNNCSNKVDRRNKRSVWTINTESYSGAHFAVYPRKLVEPCILAGCPERVCEECGQPWKREVESKRVATRPGTGSKISKDQDGLAVGNRDPQRHTTTYIDKGFSPGCYCSSTSRRGRVLDPFLGSGTTAAVAKDLGRDWIGCELNPEYVPLIRGRTEQGVLF